MSTKWRRIGWQQTELCCPEDWFLSKIAAEQASGELWLNDPLMPRLQIKWFDASKQKSVDPGATLDNYLDGLAKQAKKAKRPCEIQRDVQVVGKSGRDISSLEGFHWLSEVQGYGAIWYSRDAQRVTLAQVNGALDESDLKNLARAVLASIQDAPEGEDSLWTAYDLSCRIPKGWTLAGQTMETGRTELKFSKSKNTLTITRYGLASIALERAGDLGDWAHGLRFKDWITYRLDRDEGEHGGHSAVTFRGRRKSAMEKFREWIYHLVGQAYPARVAAKVWHCEEANCLYLVEQVHDSRSDEILEAVCASIPDTPETFNRPK